MTIGFNNTQFSLLQNQFRTNQNNINQAIERLSTGLRINSAADDPAGLAISTNLTSNIDGFTAANRNANDAISMSQTAEGGLASIEDNLQSIRNLALEASNATLNDADRQSLNDEAQQRIDEINRIAEDTGFNGMTLLDGSTGEKTFQIGPNAGDTVSISLNKSFQKNDIGKAATATLNFEGQSGDFEIKTGNNPTSTIYVDSDDSAQNIADQVENVRGIDSADARNQQTLAFDTINSSGGDEATVRFDVNVDGVTQSVSTTISDGESLNATQLAERINNDIDNVSARVSGDGIELETTEGQNISIDQQLESGTINETLGTDGGFQNTDTGTTFVGQVDINAQNTITVSNQDDVVIDDVDGNALAANDGAIIEATGSLDSLSIATPDKAVESITRLDKALDEVSAERAQLGSFQNRFESIIDNNSNQVNNLTQARSRIQDADIASEMSRLVRFQTLQNAGLAVAGQAYQNQLQVVSLLMPSNNS